jgi:nitrous oxidase accessory protein
VTVAVLRRGIVPLGLLTMTCAGRVHAQRRIDVSPSGAIRSVTAGVAAARDRDTVVVHAGLYREPTITVSRQIALVGEGAAILDGEGKRPLIVVRADDVTVVGLTLRNVGTSFVEDRAALRVEQARGCVIERNRVENAFFGIYLANVNDCRIADNVIRASAQRETESGNGIHLWTSRRVTITRNTVSGHRDGIYFEFVHDSRIRGNVSERNLRYGLHFMYSDDCHYVGNTFRHNGSGVAVMYTRRVEMTANHFEDNWGAAAYGLLLKEISDATLERNVFAHNTVGLFVDGASRLGARHNAFRGNGWALKLDANTIDGEFRGNNFVGNSFDVATNSRFLATTFAGNYWDGYRGYDLNRDGIGDVPHRPVRLFSVIVGENAPALILMRSAFVELLDNAERALPSLTPNSLVDSTPAMRPVP